MVGIITSVAIILEAGIFGILIIRRQRKNEQRRGRTKD